MQTRPTTYRFDGTTIVGPSGQVLTISDAITKAKFHLGEVALTHDRPDMADLCEHDIKRAGELTAAIMAAHLAGGDLSARQAQAVGAGS